jgi:molybdate-binding protein/predicted nucleic acid-binding protein
VPGGVRLLWDTSFCLHLIRTRPSQLAAWLAGFAPGEIGVSALTAAALQYRVEHSRDPERNRRALATFLLPLVILPFDEAAAAALGRVAATWGPDPRATTPHAQMIAAQAIALRATVATAMPERYAAIPELRLHAPFVLPRLEDAVRAPRLPATIVAVGSHDLTLDLLGDYLHAQHPEITLLSAHVGSEGGLLALQRNAAHLAGCHLLDAATGDYNQAAVRRILTAHGRRVVLVGFVSRIQGLLVAPGNPRGLRSIDDLARRDVRFVNRQPGAGTRVLLDLELQRRGIPPDRIDGYARQEASHTAVAAAVADGEADCGVGIQAAAQGHGLDFVPLYEERYDLVIPADHYASELLAPLVDLLHHPAPTFLRRVAALGGYSTARMGQVLAEL